MSLVLSSVLASLVSLFVFVHLSFYGSVYALSFSLLYLSFPIPVSSSSYMISPALEHRQETFGSEFYSGNLLKSFINSTTSSRFSIWELAMCLLALFAGRSSPTFNSPQPEARVEANVGFFRFRHPDLEKFHQICSYNKHVCVLSSPNRLVFASVCLARRRHDSFSGDATNVSPPLQSYPLKACWAGDKTCLLGFNYQSRLQRPIFISAFIRLSHPRSELAGAILEASSHRTSLVLDGTLAWHRTRRSFPTAVETYRCYHRDFIRACLFLDSVDLEFPTRSISFRTTMQPPPTNFTERFTVKPKAYLPIRPRSTKIIWLKRIRLMNRHKKVSGRGRRLSLVFASQSTQVSFNQLYTSRPRIKLHQGTIESYMSDPSPVNLISRLVTTGCITPADHLAYQFVISAFLACKMVAKGSSRFWHFSSPSTHPSRCLGSSFDYVARLSIPTCAMFALKSKLTIPLVFLIRHNALYGRGLRPMLVYTWIHGLAGFSFSRCYLLVLSNLPFMRRLQISSHRERPFSYSCFKESFFTLSFMLKRTVPPLFSSMEIVFKRSMVLKTLRASCVVRSSLLALALDFDFVSIICETFWQKFPVSIYDSYRHFILYWICTLVSVTSVSYSLAKSHPFVT